MMKMRQKELFPRFLLIALRNCFVFCQSEELINFRAFLLEGNVAAKIAGLISLLVDLENETLERGSKFRQGRK